MTGAESGTGVEAVIDVEATTKDEELATTKDEESATGTVF